MLPCCLQTYPIDTKVLAAIEVVVFAILEGKRYEGYKKTGEVCAGQDRLGRAATAQQQQQCSDSNSSTWQRRRSTLHDTAGSLFIKRALRADATSQNAAITAATAAATNCSAVGLCWWNTAGKGVMPLQGLQDRQQLSKPIDLAAAG